MKKGTWLVLTAVAVVIVIAGAAFYLGSYVFPHGKSPATAPETPAAAPTGTLASFGINASDDAVAASADSTAASLVLDAETLASLAEPAPGRLVGVVRQYDASSRTATVQVQSFGVSVPAADGGTEQRSLPGGITVRVVLPEDVVRTAAPADGVLILANIRIEPATGTESARIVAVTLEVPGATP